MARGARRLIEKLKSGPPWHLSAGEKTLYRQYS